MRIRLASFCILGIAASLWGCKTYTGEFSVKSEEELVQMEREANSARVYFQDGNYDAADQVLSRLGTDRTVSQPLYRVDRVPVLLLSGRKEEAHELLMDVREEIETLYDAQLEERAQSIWHGEANKVYKGDAHERSTLYALLALSFMDRGQYEDALRSVKNGLLADCFGSTDAYNADYGLLHYIGWVCALRCNENDTADRHREALLKSLESQGVKIRDCSCLMPEGAGLPNALVVIWTGTPPSYSRGGEYGEKRMVLSGAKSQFDFVTVEDASGQERIVPAGLGDVNFQATTRGGRLMDNVLQDKADVKENFKTAANASLVLSGACFAAGTALIGGNEYLAIAGLCCYGAGVCCLVADVAFMWAHEDVDANADTRSWQTLPGQLNVLPLNLPVGKRQLKVRGYISGDVMMERVLEVDVPDDGKTAVVHVPCMGNDTLGKAVKLFNTTSEIARNKAPVDPVLAYGSLGGSYDTSASYAIIGTDIAGSQLVMRDAVLANAISKAMVEHGYLRHYRAATSDDEGKGLMPDLVMGAMGEQFWVRSVDGQGVLDTRVTVMVRRPGVLRDGKFNSGKVRFFYGWSRIPTTEMQDSLTDATKSIGRKNAIDNLFRVHDFRAAISKAGAFVPVAPSAPAKPSPDAARILAVQDAVTNATPVSAYVEKDLIGNWESSYTMSSTSVVAGRETKTSTPSAETLILKPDRSFERTQLANGKSRSFTGTWCYTNAELTVETAAPDGKSKKTMRYRILPKTGASFEMRFADLAAYQNEINSSGKCTAVAEYLGDGTLVTKITTPVPNQDPVVTTIAQPIKTFIRVSQGDR